MNKNFPFFKRKLNFVILSKRYHSILNVLSLSIWWSSSLWLSGGSKCRLQCQIQWNLLFDLFALIAYFEDITSFHVVCLFVKMESLAWIVKAVIPFRFIRSYRLTSVANEIEAFNITGCWSKILHSPNYVKLWMQEKN